MNEARMSFVANPDFALKSLDDLEPREYFLQLGTHQWFFKHKVSHLYVFVSQASFDAVSDDDMPVYDDRIFQEDELKALIYAGFLFKNHPTRVKLS
jgi:hypothetical protein